MKPFIFEHLEEVSVY